MEGQLQPCGTPPGRVFAKMSMKTGTDAMRLINYQVRGKDGCVRGVRGPDSLSVALTPAGNYSKDKLEQNNCSHMQRVRQSVGFMVSGDAATSFSDSLKSGSDSSGACC